MFLYAVGAAGLTLWLGFAAVAAQTEGFSVRSQQSLRFAPLLFVRFVTDLLGYLARFFICNVLLDLLDQFWADPTAGFNAFGPSAVLRVLAAPYAVFFGAGGATSLPLYGWLVATAEPLFLALLVGQGRLSGL